MRIALTGGTGFLGRYLIAKLTENGHQVWAWYRGDRPEDTGDGVQWIKGRLGQTAEADQLVKSADAIIHSGLARSGASFLDSGEDPLQYWDLNATGSLRLLEAARKAGVSRFVFISSGAVHDRVVPGRPLDEDHPLRPQTLYGACKASVETLIHHYGTSGTLCAASLRPTSIYGLDRPASHSKWYEMIAKICRGEDVEATGGSKAVHAGDVAEAALRLINHDDSIAGETFNCCDRMISDYEVATIAKRLTESGSEITGQPKIAKHEIVTDKIRSLGMNFGGDALLEKTIAQVISAIQNAS